MPPVSASLERSQDGQGRRTLLLMLAGWLVFIGVLIAIVANRQHIYDQWRLWNYRAPAAIQQLADQDGMTDYAKHLFYLNRPQLLSSVSDFRRHCPDNKDTVVLGCYHPNQAGIYIYNVKDNELQGVAQVTAAHEDLHAIYGRLSDKDRKYVNGLLQDYYEHGLKDERVRSEIKLYQKTEPNDVVDEMHSTFGTEIADLPPSLEAYYKRYFRDRAVIVRYQQQYQQAFSARQQVVMADDQQLTVMKAQINSQQAQVDSQQVQVQAAKSRLDSLLAGGRNDAYNDEVGGYNAQVNAYNANLASLRTLIDAYNRIVATRNSVADQLNLLNAALDTRLAPQQAR